jgi:UDPglucose 6-dehydrogenase
MSSTKSIVPLGTGDKLRDVIKSHQSNECRFDIVSNPEFLRKGPPLKISCTRTEW